MCTCAGAPMMSSAVLRAATCWNARAPILTSRQARSKYLGPGMAFWTGFFDSGEAGHDEEGCERDVAGVEDASS